MYLLILLKKKKKFIDNHGHKTTTNVSKSTAL